MAAPKRFKIPQSVLVVIYTADLHVLLIRRADVSDAEFWQSVTGSKDAESESFRATAVREVQEETGIDCGPHSALHAGLQDWQLENTYSIYPRWLHRYAPGVLQNTERVFGLQLPAHWDRAAVRLNPREHSDQVWLPLHAAAERCFSPSNAEAVLLVPRFAVQPVLPQESP
jgi:dATP pyrophosphohydrolase